MAIVKNNFKASRFDPGFSPVDVCSEDDDDVRARFDRFGAESDEDVDGDLEDEEGGDEDEDKFNDVDSGVGSDDFDLLELGDLGEEFCQVGMVTCSVPFELYDLLGLEDVLRVDVWNEMLSEEEKFGLSKLLPDMDQLTFIQTLKELFEGKNFHFGSPVKKLFEMLKGGQCEPRVALYRQGLSSFERQQHYHFLRNYHNAMVGGLCQMRDAWASCKGYSIEEKLRVLNIMKSQKSLMHDKVGKGLESDTMEEEFGDVAWGKRVKDKKGAQKLGCSSAYGVSSSLEFASRMPFVGMEVEKYGKRNSKGILKLAGPGNESVDQFPSAYHGMDPNSRLNGLAVPIPRPSKAAQHDKGLRQGSMVRVDYDDDEADTVDAIYGLGFQGSQHATHSSGISKSGRSKAGRNRDLLRSKASAVDGHVSSAVAYQNDFSTAYSRIRTVNQLPEVKTFAARPSSFQSEFVRRAKYPETIHQCAIDEQMKSLRGRAVQTPAVNNRFGLFNYADPTWHSKSKGQFFPAQSSHGHEDWNLSSRKLKEGMEPSHFNFHSYRASSPPVEDRVLSEFRTKLAKAKQLKLVQNGRSHKGAVRGTYQKVDETESDSSEYFDHEDQDESPFTKRMSAYSYSSIAANDSQLSSMKFGLDAKKPKAAKKYMQENEMDFNGLNHFRNVEDSCPELLPVVGLSSKAKLKGTHQNSGLLHNSSIRVFVDNSPFSMQKLKDVDERKVMKKMVKNGQLRAEVGDSVPVSSSKFHSSDGKQKDEIKGYDTVADDEILHDNQFQVDENVPNRFVKKRSKANAKIHDRVDRFEDSLQGCSSGAKKRKVKEEPAMEMNGRDEADNAQPILQDITEEQSTLKKKGKRKLESDINIVDVDSSQPPSGAGAPALVVELETKPQKKTYVPITPTLHTGFSFSIVHLLSAVRLAMITPSPEVSLDIGKQKEGQDEKLKGGSNDIVRFDNTDGGSKSENVSQACGSAISVQEIVNRVRSNPGDPCVLETQEPLQDLVRGVLKLFSSKTAPLGAKGWKALVAYEKSNKSWLWIGPASQTPTDHEINEEVASPKYWGVPQKMLVKLVDAFANWLKTSQETLKQIGSLPAPPLALMQGNLDEKERFKDMRAQKSLNTISSSSEEVRDYFRKEEVLRYSVPDRAFSYTATDGKKSIVAPLRRCGGKPNSKARDHFMLKKDRPPHVTILCLVRDAAARLPGHIGTRADVCTLIRDSQYIVEDITDAQVNQIVSGALDRLHYECDPCVQYDGERKLWVYLHRDREEVDFEDDGTSSTKKWKRPKKDPNEQSDQGTVTVAFHGTGDQHGSDVGSDLNFERPSTDCDIKDPNLEVATEATTLVQDDVIQINVDNTDTNTEPDQGNVDHGDPTAWDALNLNPGMENELLCRVNSTNEDFVDETFGRGQVKLLGASSL